jgi:hypothetical protein
MAKFGFNSSDLITSIKARAAIPLAQSSFSEDDLLNFATEELNLKILPSVLSVREEFYVTEASVPMVSNQSNYKIPYRAVGGKVRFVYLMQSNTQAKPLAQLPMESLVDYKASSFAYQESGFYLQNDEIIILPPISGIVSASLKFKYYLRPNAIVALSRGALITDINTGTGVITVASVPSNISVTSQVDFIGTTGNFKTKGFDITANVVNTVSKTITVDPASIPSDLAVGDYMCSAGESVIPQIPSELHVMLAQAVACRVLEAIGDTTGLANANAKLAEMEQKLLNVIDNRVEAPGRKVSNRNSFFRNNRFVRRWYN